MARVEDTHQLNAVRCLSNANAGMAK